VRPSACVGSPIAYIHITVVGGLPFNTSLWTYVSNRELHVLYFDGMSAKLGPDGILDSQEVLLERRGGVLTREWWDDYGRLEALCKWAKGRGIDGFIRQNTVGHRQRTDVCVY
jgi:hypothetical protein